VTSWVCWQSGPGRQPQYLSAAHHLRHDPADLAHWRSPPARQEHYLDQRHHRDRPDQCLQFRAHARAPVQRLRRSTRLRARGLCVERQDIAIVPRVEGPVTTPRIDTHYLVTEFGSTNLKGLSSTERAHALIGLAHPQFRDELTGAAKKLNLI
jgi:hypothetical protein